MTFVHAIGRRSGWCDGRNVERFCETQCLFCLMFGSFTLFNLHVRAVKMHGKILKNRKYARNNLLLIGAKMFVCLLV